jgi:hypothetical protein
MIFLSSRHARLSGPGLLGIALVLILAGCGNTANYNDLDEREKAGLITKLRRQAEDQLAIFMQSGGSDLDALLEHVRLHGETTKVAPTTCGRCFEYYGRALSRLGRFYEVEVTELEKTRDDASGDQIEELDRKIAELNELRLDAYKKSNQQFEVLFQSGEPINPDAYEWMSGQAAALGDYRKAIYYLELFVQSYPLDPEGQKNAKARKLAFEKEIRRQEEAELQRELESDTAPRPKRKKTGSKG